MIKMHKYLERYLDILFLGIWLKRCACIFKWNFWCSKALRKTQILMLNVYKSVHVISLLWHVFLQMRQWFIRIMLLIVRRVYWLVKNQLFWPFEKCLGATVSLYWVQLIWRKQSGSRYLSNCSFQTIRLVNWIQYMIKCSMILRESTLEIITATKMKSFRTIGNDRNEKKKHDSKESKSSTKRGWI